MPRFITNRDYQFFQHINKELVVDVIDVEVILYKIINEIVDVNIYGESTTKPYYKGISLNAIIKYPKTVPETDDGFGYDVAQTSVEFRFVRKLLEDVNVYPDVGDIISYNDNFYTIDNTNEVQLIGSRPEYNQAIICETHMTRRSMINIEETHI